MENFFENIVLPVVIILAHSLAILVALLVLTAYIIYADHKIWAAVQMRRGQMLIRGALNLQIF